MPWKKDFRMHPNPHLGYGAARDMLGAHYNNPRGFVRKSVRFFDYSLEKVWSFSDYSSEKV